MSQMLIVLAVFSYAAFLVCVSLHDMAQAWMASRLGDPTARMLGRLTMNPVRHFNLWGMGIWPAVDLLIYHMPFVLGWSTPIPITSRNLQKPRRDENLIYMAGLAAHFLGAVFCLIVLLIMKHASGPVAASLEYARLLTQHYDVDTTGLPGIFPIVLLLYYGILTNIILMVFNLVPLPLFDGGKILRNYLPYNAQKTFDSMAIYLMLGFFLIGFGLVINFANPVLAIFFGLLRAL